MHSIITKLTELSLPFFLVLSLSACGSSTSAGEPVPEMTPEAPAESSETESPISYSTYEDIYNDYSKKLTDTGSKLLEEYRIEAAFSTNGVEGRREIARSKASAIVDLYWEGINRMRDFHNSIEENDNAKLNTLEDKLWDIADAQQEKIADAFTESLPDGQY